VLEEDIWTQGDEATMSETIRDKELCYLYAWLNAVIFKERKIMWAEHVVGMGKIINLKGIG
jgi:hypothetical protein